MLFEKSLNYHCIFRLPDWVPSLIETHGDLEQFVVQEYIFSSATTELKKLNGGYLLKEIFDRISDKLASTLSPDRSFCLYSAHERTLAIILNSLGLFEVVFCFVLLKCLLNIIFFFFITEHYLLAATHSSIRFLPHV